MDKQPQGPAVGIFPGMPTPGALGVFTRPEKVDEIKKLELEGTPLENVG